ncbi:aldo/keto reductase [Pedobacter frigoris]|uniref:aldo/keto reductase n=1 Tax=Pedobacter frigoris TaxID=2571272 RepID=UPI0029318ECF|nr:aldo/keto reductase [Pedobacter frigoris]
MQSSQFLSKCILGTAGLGGVWGAVQKEESVRTILLALETGIHGLDTAPAYGDAEEFVGEALKQWNGELPKVSTKVGRLKSYAADNGIYDYSASSMEQSLFRSLKTLNVEAVDVLFLHDPSAISEKADIDQIFRQMQWFKQRGYAKKIGIGGNCPSWFKKYDYKAVFDVIMEYNRLDACCSDALTSSIPEYQSNEIQFYSASPLHMGLLGSRYQEFIDSAPDWLDKNSIGQAIRVKEIADRYHLPLSSLAHRFVLSIPEDFKMVIGPVDTRQLLETLCDIHEGPLSNTIFEEIIALKTV